MESRWLSSRALGFRGLRGFRLFRGFRELRGCRRIRGFRDGKREPPEPPKYGESCFFDAHEGLWVMTLPTQGVQVGLKNAIPTV